jgi:hypothetical protein
MKSVSISILGASLLCLTVTSLAQSDIALRQDVIDESKYIVGNEETEITKEYVTALALDGMHRLFESGLEFLSRDGKSTIREVERKKEAIECAFRYALISNEHQYWNPHYIGCVKATGQITGNLRDDVARNGIYVATRISPTKDPRPVMIGDGKEC